MQLSEDGVITIKVHVLRKLFRQWINVYFIVYGTGRNEDIVLSQNNGQKDRYFVREGSRDWIFRTEKVKLIFASDIKIKRHVLIKFEAHPYLRDYDEYYSKQRVAC